MAVFGCLNDVENELNWLDADIVFKYLQEANRQGSETYNRISGLNIDQYEKVELTGNIFAIEQSYYTRTVNDSFYEAHKNYVDMQFMLEGEERIYVANIESLNITAIYDEEHDYSKYSTEAESSILLLNAGKLAVLYPQDGHMPSISTTAQTQRVYKTVVKMPISQL